MRLEFKKSIQTAKDLLSESEDPAHNLIHVKSVVKTATKISKEYNEINKDLIEVAAWWHDVGRLYNDNHEKLSARMAFESLKNLGVEISLCEKACNAIAFHKWTMQPKTIEGEIVRDGDKLGYIAIPRWKSCLQDNNLTALKDITDLLPILKSYILHLKISKGIYDKQIIKFKNFIIKKENPGFDKIKKQILKYDL